MGDDKLMPAYGEAWPSLGHNSELESNMSTVQTNDTDAEIDTNIQSVDVGMAAEDMIRKRITHTLSIFPRISPSMLQVGIGTGMPPALWHPVLDQMVADNLVNRYQVSATNPVTGRDQVYTIIEGRDYQRSGSGTSPLV